MVILIKTTAGLDVKTSKGVLSLNGFGLINQVSSELWAEAKKQSTIQDMLEKGYIIEGGSSENAKADTMAEAGNKQAKVKNPKVIKE